MSRPPRSAHPRTFLFLAALALIVGLVLDSPSTGVEQEREGSEPVAAQGESHHADARGRSRQEVLLQDPLYAIEGKQAHFLRIEYPPGWIGRRHYHTGDVFLYVLEGSFTIDLAGGKRTTIGPGEVYHEAVKTEMQARNPSATEPTKLLLLQVGNQGERMTVITD